MFVDMTEIFKKKIKIVRFPQTQNFQKYILCPTKVNLENESDLYSACSNPSDVVLLIVLGMIIGQGA
jgi:hypothetical protein